MYTITSALIQIHNVWTEADVQLLLLFVVCTQVFVPTKQHQLQVHSDWRFVYRWDQLTWCLNTALDGKLFDTTSVCSPDGKTKQNKLVYKDWDATTSRQKHFWSVWMWLICNTLDIKDDLSVFPFVPFEPFVAAEEAACTMCPSC